MSTKEKRNSGSPNWAGMRIMGSMQESLIGISTMRQAIGIAISAATSLSVCLFIPKDIEPCLLAKHKTKPQKVLVDKAIESSGVK